MTKLNVFFERLWQQYSSICPQALAIHSLFASEGEQLVNDHVAFRTFANSKISIDHLEPEIFALGYKQLDSYHFEKKKLDARCYIHPDSPTKIFISELLWQELSDTAQQIIAKIILQANVNCSTKPEPLLSAGRLWNLPNYKDYLTLLDESEYAAWLAVWGLRANHFTLFVNYFKKYPQLDQVVGLLQKNGYRLNHAGGLIKGSAKELLVQSSTMADLLAVDFKDAGKQQVSTCYYEFAQRFKQTNGLLYQGFVPSSADKIFESTNIGIAKD